MKRITNAEAASLWAQREPVFVRCTTINRRLGPDPWVELSDDYGLEVLRSEIHEFATPETMKINGQTLNMPDRVGVESDNGVLLHFNSFEERSRFLQAIQKESLVK